MPTQPFSPVGTGITFATHRDGVCELYVMVFFPREYVGWLRSSTTNEHCLPLQKEVLLDRSHSSLAVR